jgi:hypothetical protein
MGEQDVDSGETGYHGSAEVYLRQDHWLFGKPHPLYSILRALVTDRTQGYGHIARETARVLKCMNAKIIAANSSGSKRLDEGVGPARVFGLGAGADLVFSTLSRERATRKVSRN